MEPLVLMVSQDQTVQLEPQEHKDLLAQLDSLAPLVPQEPLD